MLLDYLTSFAHTFNSETRFPESGNNDKNQEKLHSYFADGSFSDSNLEDLPWDVEMEVDKEHDIFAFYTAMSKLPTDGFEFSKANT